MSSNGRVQDYRTSHASEGYGKKYQETYRSGYYFWQWENIERPLVDSVFREFVAAGCTNHLDFACGTGRILSVASTIFPKTTGVDISGSMLEICRQSCPSSKLVHADITQKPLSERFDSASSFRFFLNAEPELRSAALKSLHASLVPGGWFVANIHVNSTSPAGLAYRTRNKILPKAHANTFGLKEFAEILDEHGFRPLRTVHYSLLPRTGPVFGWPGRFLMVPMENIFNALPLIPRGVAQSFLVICRAT